MAKKQRTPSRKAAESPRADGPGPNPTGPATATAATSAPAPATPARGQPDPAALPPEVTRGDWTVALFAVMAFLAPVLGSPVPELMHDTLKATAVALLTLLAALGFFWRQRERREALRWHVFMWVPVFLVLHALGSMVWSHTYLAGVEAVRWFLFGLILWLGINTFSRERLPWLAWGIHLGAVGAGCWAALQFWLDVKFFAQGPNPASTFVNRNFFGEFVACTLPFGLFLLAQARSSGRIGALAVTNGFVMVCLMMTGTRSALAAMWLNLLLILPWAAWHWRGQLALARWTGRQRALAAGLLLATVAGLGLVPTGNPELAAEQRGSNALERAVLRTRAIRFADPSLDYRFLFLKETAVLIRANPLAGVGAGAWQVDIARYQNPGADIDNHGHVHNEAVQMIAEYGLAGWLALLVLLGGLLRIGWATLAAGRSDPAQAEGPARMAALCSVLALLLTSSVGFPWHLTSTLVVFALSLGILGASQARAGAAGRGAASRLPWRPMASQLMAVALLVCSVAALYVAARAMRAERALVTAARIGALLTTSGDTKGRSQDEVKAMMMANLQEGMAAAPHYRWLIEPPAEMLTRLRDWKNAALAWDALSASRPHSVSLMASAARAHIMAGDPAKAQVYVGLIRQQRPDSQAWMPLQVLLAAKAGQDREAVALAGQALKLGLDDFAMLNAAFEAAWRAGDPAAATAFMERRMAAYPATRQHGLILLGNMQTTAVKQPARALEYFRAALALSPPDGRQALQAQIPQVHWAALGLAAAAPAAAPAPVAAAASRR